MLDGFIAGAAALAAVRLAAVRPFLIAAHRSAEPGHKVVLDNLGLRALLDLDLRLGEGTGAALAIHLVDDALSIHREMATFSEAGVRPCLIGRLGELSPMDILCSRPILNGTMSGWPRTNPRAVASSRPAHKAYESAV